ncbi:hypothetical protein H6G20_14775 [Desertifilum sp. FACHB-1129]|uniref:Uncharacterized protein n=2 Tax=Desertifilum TaxID=1185872 RepID=A0ACD5GMW2_9CYAN|nr:MULTISPECIES: hypothetical protein [Desertifilum]MBD2312933.1 hypothetical protein [Desertifilum sp. FACHB-1129]MBD2333655.1 hypothetical protein [Desertifilum sp. FACHB-868]
MPIEARAAKVKPIRVMRFMGEYRTRSRNSFIVYPSAIALNQPKERPLFSTAVAQAHPLRWTNRTGVNQTAL